MAEYIEREAAIGAVKKERDYTGKFTFEEEHAWAVGFQQGITFALSDIAAIPAADVVPMSWVREHMSGDYISRKKAVENVLDQMRHSKSETAMRERLLNMVAADVRPVARGKWTMNSDFPDRLICSKCGAQFDVWHWEAKQMHFCPNCGAEMEGN